MAEVPVPRSKPRAPEQAFNRNPNFRDFLIDAFSAAGASRKGTGISPNQLANRTETFLDVAPVSGQIRAADKVNTDIGNDNYGSAVINAIGALPGFVAPAAKNALKSVLINNSSGLKEFGMVKSTPSPLQNDQLFGSFSIQGRQPIKKMSVSTVTDEDKIAERVASGQLTKDQGTNLTQGLTDPVNSPYLQDEALLRGLDLTDAVNLGIVPGSLTPTQMTDIFGPALRHSSMNNLEDVMYQRISGARGGTPASAKTQYLPVKSLRGRAERAGIEPAGERVIKDSNIYTINNNSVGNRVKRARAEKGGYAEPDDINAIPQRPDPEFISINEMTQRQSYFDDMAYSADTGANQTYHGRQVFGTRHQNNPTVIDVVDAETGRILDTLEDPNSIPF